MCHRKSQHQTMEPALWQCHTPKGSKRHVSDIENLQNMHASSHNHGTKRLQHVPALVIDQGVHLLGTNGELVTGPRGDLVDHWQRPTALLQGFQVSYTKVPPCGCVADVKPTAPGDDTPMDFTTPRRCISSSASQVSMSFPD